MNTKTLARRGKHFGSDFERLISLQAVRSQMLLVEHGVKVRYTGSRIIPMKSDLDYRLMRDGQCVFFDAKSRQGATLPLSSLSPQQRTLVETYAAQGFVSGFLAQLRQTDKVVFFSHQNVVDAGVRGSLSAGQGKVLGDSNSFALGLLFG